MENFINNAPFALVLVCLVIGFVLLIKGADFFVEGSSPLLPGEHHFRRPRSVYQLHLPATTSLPSVMSLVPISLT